MDCRCPCWTRQACSCPCTYAVARSTSTRDDAEFAAKLLALRGPEAASYELTVRFTRTGGKDTVCVTIPVGRRRCCLVLDSWNGKRLVSWHGRPSALGIGHPEYAPRRRDALGLAFKKGNVTFHSARLVALP